MRRLLQHFMKNRIFAEESHEDFVVLYLPFLSGRCSSAVSLKDVVEVRDGVILRKARDLPATSSKLHLHAKQRFYSFWFTHARMKQVEGRAGMSVERYCKPGVVWNHIARESLLKMAVLFELIAQDALFVKLENAGCM